MDGHPPSLSRSDDSGVGTHGAPSRALSKFSDLLYDVKDSLKEGQYLEICNAAQALHDEHKSANDRDVPGYRSLPSVTYRSLLANNDAQDRYDAQSLSIDNPRLAAIRAQEARERNVDAIENFRVMLYQLQTDVDRLRDDNGGLESQLNEATATIDHLRERRDYYSKTTKALKRVLVRHEIPDSELLQAYEERGIKDKVLAQREARKRARSVDAVDAVADDSD